MGQDLPAISNISQNIFNLTNISLFTRIRKVQTKGKYKEQKINGWGRKKCWNGKYCTKKECKFDHEKNTENIKDHNKQADKLNGNGRDRRDRIRKVECRDGLRCTRSKCKYWHPNRNDQLNTQDKSSNQNFLEEALAQAVQMLMKEMRLGPWKN